MTLCLLRDWSIDATDLSDSRVVRPVASSRMALSGTPSPMTYLRLTAASLVVSPTPTPPVRTTRGASPRRQSPTAWSSRALSTGDGFPQYCAAPSTTMASLALARSRLPHVMTAPRASSQRAATTTVAYQATRKNDRKGDSSCDACEVAHKLTS